MSEINANIKFSKVNSAKKIEIAKTNNAIKNTKSKNFIASNPNSRTSSVSRNKFNTLSNIRFRRRCIP
jgi:hypothetical protein